MTTCILIHTTGGKVYARKIGKSLNKLGIKYLLSSVQDYPNVHVRHPELNPNNCFIHSRAAHPYITGAFWLRSLAHTQAMNYQVINDVETLQLTSNKLKCSLLFNQINLPHPMTYQFPQYEYYKQWEKLPAGNYVVKPLTSTGQGKFVQQYSKGNNATVEKFDKVMIKVPGKNRVVQEFVDAIALHRVIVLNGKALAFSFVDKLKDDWKLSVCLNKVSMEYSANPDNELLKLAEKAQNAVNGKVNFIDVFETKVGYKVSEINTACNLSIHEKLSGVDISEQIARTLKEVLHV